jgi:LEA14-like dessication related protein
MMRVLVFAAALAAAACHPAERPTVNCTGVAVTSAGLRGIDARVDFTIYNPNSLSVPLRRIDWQLAIGGAQTLTGKADLTAEIPAHQNAPMPVSIHVGALDAATTAARLAAGARDYQIAGSLTFATKIGDISVDFSQRGQLGP